NEAVAAAERLLTLAASDITYRKGVLKAAETQRTNEQARVTKATATNEVVTKIVQEKMKSFESSNEAKVAGEKLVADLKARIEKQSGELRTNKADSLPAVASTAPDKAAPVLTNAVDAKVLTELKEKLKQASDKL